MNNIAELIATGVNVRCYGVPGIPDGSILPVGGEIELSGFIELRLWRSDEGEPVVIDILHTSDEVLADYTARRVT